MRLSALNDIADGGFAQGGQNIHYLEKRLAERGIRAWFALDEGGGVIDRHPLTDGPAALIGVSERGSGAMRVRAAGPGVPPPRRRSSTSGVVGTMPLKMIGVSVCTPAPG